MDQVKEAFEPKERNSEAMKSFGFRLKNQFSVNESYRRTKELQWLEDLRAVKGIYDPDVKLDPNASKVYPKITRSKINIVLSRLHEMLFPETERNWEIVPTPEPKISQENLLKILDSIMQERIMKAQQTGEQPKPPSMDEISLAIKRFCDSACMSMSSVIDDQLTEMCYSEETKKVLRSGLTYGTGIMKGPLINQRVRHKWGADTEGNYSPKDEEEDVPYFEAVRIWDWYPDMTVTDIEMIEGSFERHLMSKHDLRKLLKREDYYPEMITSYMTEHPNGDYVPKPWEVDLQMIEVQAGAGNKNGSYTMVQGATDSAIPSSRVSDRQIGKKYQVLEYWGYVDGTDLSACGIEIEDQSLEYLCNVWLLGNVPIKAVLFEGALDQYKVFYYEKDETSLYGEGLARIMRDSQLGTSAASRMVLDNAACVSGPQVEVNWSLAEPDSDLTSFYPRKIWFRSGRGVEAQYPAIRALNFDSHIEELMSIVNMFKEFADIETTLPTWMIGEKVTNETAQATSGRMATITISIKDVVKNFDSFTERIIKDLYAWNMEFNPRPDIKGDYKVNPRGVSSLVMKEIRMQALTQLTSTLTDEEWIYIPKREFLVEKLKAHDINIKLLTEEEANEVREAQSNSEMAQLQKDALKAEIAKDKAQALANVTKAKEKNVQAIKAAQEQEVGAADPRLTEMELQKKQAEIDSIAEKNRLAGADAELRSASAIQKMDHDAMNAQEKMRREQEMHDLAMGIKHTQAQHSMKLKEEAAKTQKKEKKPVK